MPASDERNLFLSQFQLLFCFFEILDFFDAGGAEISRAAHAALMQSHARTGHLTHAVFNFTFPEVGAILFQPQHDLPELVIECCETGAGFVLESNHCAAELLNGVGG